MLVGATLLRTRAVYSVEILRLVTRWWARVSILVWDPMLSLIAVLLSSNSLGLRTRVCVTLVWCTRLFDSVDMCVGVWLVRLISVSILVMWVVVGWCGTLRRVVRHTRPR